LTLVSIRVGRVGALIWAMRGGAPIHPAKHPILSQFNYIHADNVPNGRLAYKSQHKQLDMGINQIGFSQNCWWISKICQKR
jgi:hypothetical protein